MQSGIQFKKFIKDHDPIKEEPFFSGGRSLLTKLNTTQEEYAGIDSSHLKIYAEQIGLNGHDVSEEAYKLLAEDINYKLRTVLSEALIKARLSGYNGISSKNIDETFEQLNVDKIYGAPQNPLWLKQEHGNCLTLPDQEVNLLDVVKERTIRYKSEKITITTTYHLDHETKLSSYKPYFTSLCEAILNTENEESRLTALKIIAKNPEIGPIIEWFYNFAFLALSQSAYDPHVPIILRLIETLESSPLTNTNVSNKQLKLLLSLLLSRILANTDESTLRLMCSTLATICLREVLFKLIVTNLCDMISAEEYKNSKMQFLMMINALGILAIDKVFIPNIKYFLSSILNDPKGSIDDSLFFPLLKTYSNIQKSGLTVHNEVYDKLKGVFRKFSIIWNPTTITSEVKKDPINLVTMLTKLIKTRRTDHISKSGKTKKNSMRDLFNLPSENSPMGKLLKKHEFESKSSRKHIVIGKTTLMLSVLQQNRKKSVNSNFNLMSYNF